MMRTLILLFAVAVPCLAADYYFDNAASGDNGTSWANAWQTTVKQDGYTP